MKIAGAALNQTPIDWENNLQNIISAINDAKEKQVEILCLPELCITGYGCEDLFHSEWVIIKAFKQLLTLLPETKNIVVAIGIPLLYNEKAYNTACLIENGEILGFVPKQFLANDGIHYEHRWFTPWKRGEKTIINIHNKQYHFGDIVLSTSKGIKIGFEICEDAWRTDRPGPSLKERNVDIIFNPSASHFAFNKTDLRKKLVIQSSKDYDCWYVYANLLGNEAGKVIYDGELIIAHKGKLKASNPILSFKPTNLLVTDKDSSEGHFPPIKNDEFEKAVSLGLFDYLRKSRTKSFVVSLSGGADSSACAVLIAQMIRNGINELGQEDFCKRINLDYKSALIGSELEKDICSKLLFTAYQGTENSSDDTFQSAKYLADSIGATFFSWLIDDEIASYTKKIETAIERKLDWEFDDIALQNIQARTRSPIIWLLTNLTRSLLITTSNRSEGDVGYATMDGDTSGSIAPIAGVDKHFIRNWLLWAEKKLGYYGLSKVNALNPSAELRPQTQDVKQTDEEDLMPYDVLLQIERLAIFEYNSPMEVFEKLFETAQFDKEVLKTYITKFYRLWSINQWKRERLAPSFHLDDFNVDPRTWCRFPILSGGFSEELEELKML